MSVFDPNPNATPRMSSDGIVSSLRDTRWTATAKPPDRDRPFHRIESPDFNASIPRANGRGYDCGCRSPEEDYSFSLDELRSFASAMGLDLPFPFNLITLPFDLLAHIIARTKGAFRQILRTAPSWVPDGRINYNPAFQERTREVEGVLWHSFMTWTDVPTYEWHRWYDWNFHVIPLPAHDHLRGLGNDVPVVSDLNPPAWKPVGSEHAMECEWDVGGFWGIPGPMYDDAMGGPFDPAHDWVWPMTGHYFWGAGRHIYDCGHASSDTKAVGLMRSELHPVHAFASARWEAVRFDANGGRFVPAIQFMVFASRFGGYWDFETVKPGGYFARRTAVPDECKDYEFIVDLPALEPQSEEPHPIGHTEDFAANTIVMRPRLLVHFDSSPFLSARGSVAGEADLRPIITPILPERGGIPQQVKVKIPLSALPGGKEAYGVRISMGWFDSDGRESAKVRKVTVKIDGVRKGSIDHDVLAEEWTIRLGVNGRWHHIQQPENSFHNGRTWPVNKTLVFHLALDDQIQVSAHGFDRNLIGEFLEEGSGRRRLRPGASEDTMHTVWQREVDTSSNARSQQVSRDMIFKMARTWSSGNEPIGLIDPAVETALGDAPNPITVRQFIARFGESVDVPLSITGFHTKEDEHSAELFYNMGELDYVLHYHIKVEPVSP